MSLITARQLSAQAADGIYARDLVAQAVAAAALASQLLADATRAVEQASGDLIAELTEAEAAYYAADEHDDELWASVEIGLATLAPFEDLAADLQRITRR